MKLNSVHLMHIPSSYILSFLDSSPKKCMISENVFCSAKKKFFYFTAVLFSIFQHQSLNFTYSTKSLFYTPVTFIYQLFNATYFKGNRRFYFWVIFLAMHYWTQLHKIPLNPILLLRYLEFLMPLFYNKRSIFLFSCNFPSSSDLDTVDKRHTKQQSAATITIPYDNDISDIIFSR